MLYPLVARFQYCIGHQLWIGNIDAKMLAIRKHPFGMYQVVRVQSKTIS